MSALLPEGDIGYHRSSVVVRSLKASLGDQFGKPGEKYPARPVYKRYTRYRTIIAKLRDIEQRYLHIITMTVAA